MHYSCPECSSSDSLDLMIGVSLIEREVFSWLRLALSNSALLSSWLHLSPLTKLVEPFLSESAKSDYSDTSSVSSSSMPPSAFLRVAFP